MKVQNPRPRTFSRSSPACLVKVTRFVGLEFGPFMTVRAWQIELEHRKNPRTLMAQGVWTKAAGLQDARSAVFRARGLGATPTPSCESPQLHFLVIPHHPLALLYSPRPRERVVAQDINREFSDWPRFHATQRLFYDLKGRCWAASLFLRRLAFNILQSMLRRDLCRPPPLAFATKARRFTRSWPTSG